MLHLAPQSLFFPVDGPPLKKCMDPPLQATQLGYAHLRSLPCALCAVGWIECIWQKNLFFIFYLIGRESVDYIIAVTLENFTGFVIDLEVPQRPSMQGGLITQSSDFHFLSSLWTRILQSIFRRYYVILFII